MTGIVAATAHRSAMAAAATESQTADATSAVTIAAMVVTR
jgi:hypothetical protein